MDPPPTWLSSTTPLALQLVADSALHHDDPQLSFGMQSSLHPSASTTQEMKGLQLTNFNSEMLDIVPTEVNGEETNSEAREVIEDETNSETHEAPAQIEDSTTESEVLYVGKEFATENDAYNYYNAYAKKRGFGVRRGNVERSRRPPHPIIFRSYVCNKERVKNTTDKRQEGLLVNRRPDSRVSCPAGMKIRLTVLKHWRVSKFIDEHSHKFTSPDKVHNHYSHKTHRSKACRTIISNLDQEGIRPSKIARVVNVLNAGQDGEHVTTQQCIDHIRTKSNNIGNQCISIIKSFQDRREIDPDFYFALEVDLDGTMRSVFWADGRARSSYLILGDVIVFDTTYKTNHFNLPFAPFTGVNHHRQSTLFGCALLADEQKETFVWLFTQWLKCMHGVAPKAIITDQDAQIGEAIKQVFPNTRHRFCSWHVRKHIVEHQVSLKSQYGDEFFKYFHDWYHSRDISTCEDRWMVMKEKFNIDEKVDSWLVKMYNLRAYWIDAYLKDTFWTGMTTSQRSESINSFFDGYVNTTTKLVEFIQQYDKAVETRRRAESQEDFLCLNSVPTCISNLIEIQLGKFYTRKILRIFQTELVDVMTLFCEETRKEGSKCSYLVGQFSQERDKWQEVNYENCGEIQIKCSCAFI